MRSLGWALALGAIAATTTLAQQAQRQRIVNRAESKIVEAGPPVSLSAPINVRYEGGVFGFSESLNGTLKFDDEGQQIVFRDRSSRKSFTIPYDAVMTAYGEMKKRAPKDARGVLSDSFGMLMIPYVGPYLYAAQTLKETIKKKRQFVVFQFRDPLTNAFTTTYFKLHNKQDIDPLLDRLAEKAGMTRRGDACLRLRSSARLEKPEEPSEPPVQSGARQDQAGPPGHAAEAQERAAQSTTASGQIRQEVSRPAKLSENYQFRPGVMDILRSRDDF
jgi:hypothetical protein